MKKVRGAWAAIVVTLESTSESVLKLAVEKHAGMDQYFSEFDHYVLLYPDGKLCRTLPNSNELFTVEKYKCFLHKSYTNVKLFVCKAKHYLGAKENFSDIDDDDDKENEKEENAYNIVDNIFPVSNDYVKETEKKLNESTTLYGDSSEKGKVKVETNDQDEDDFLKSFASSSKIFNIICPICGKSFPADVIENHADECAEEKKATNLLYSSISEELKTESNTIEIVSDESDGNNNEQLKNILTPEMCRKKLLEISHAVGTGPDSPTVSFTVFRGACFSDFQKHFKKPWIQSKNHCARYEVQFAGESDPIDEGGPAREFYTG